MVGSRVKIVFILVFFLGVFGFSQDKQVNEDKNKKLKQEILSVFESKGEAGLRDFVKGKNNISNKFILGLATQGVNERNEELLKISKIIAKEKTDDKLLADVYLKIGSYFRLILDYKKSIDYFEKALLIYIKLDDLVGQGNVYLREGIIYFFKGENPKALKMYRKALSLFDTAKDPLGQGNVYHSMGLVHFYKGEVSKALKMYDIALPFFEKVDSVIGQGNVYQAMADIYLYAGDYSNALKMYDKALPFFEKDGDPLNVGNMLLRKGDIYLRTGDHPNALKMHNKALPLFEDAGDYIGQGHVYHKKGIIYYNTNDYSNALEMYKKALFFFEKVDDPSAQGNVYTRIGDIYLVTGDNTRAFEMYNKALPFFEKAENPLGQGNVYQLKGDIFLRTGYYSRALEFYDKALPFFERWGEPLGQGSVYKSKGNIYFRTGNFSKAVEMYDKALPFFKKAEDPFGQGYVYLQKGSIFLKKGDKTGAFEMYDKALSFFIKAEHSLGQGYVYESKGHIYLYSGDNTRAIEMYDKALPFLEKAGTIIGQGNVYRSKGDFYSRTGDYQKALEMYNKALVLYTKVGEVESISYALHGKAKVLAKQGKNVEALSSFKKSISNLEKVRAQTTFSEMKETFLEKVYNQYEDATAFMFENDYHDWGFKHAESMKARVFYDQLAEGLVKLNKGISNDLKQKRDNLVSKLSALSKEINKVAGEQNEKKLKVLKDQYSKVEGDFEELLIKIRLNNPLYASVRYPEPVTVQNLQENILKKKELLLRYFISEDKIHVFLISKENFSVVTLKDNAEDVNRIVEKYLISVEENNHRRMKEYGKALYKKLFKPLETSIKERINIIIIPDGELATIPFESFVMDDKRSHKPVYLLEKYRIKYIQSASVLSILREHYQSERITRRFIGFGDPVYDYESFKQGKPEKGAFTRFREKNDEISQIHRGKYKREGGVLKRLQGSGQEVHTIAELFKKHTQKCVVHLREQANESNAKLPGIKEFDYIHFSCHGVLGEGFQGLVLSQIPGSPEDGYLTLNEIMNCDYNAKLVVLSACRTGKGKMERAEGVTGLTRAVMYAGTPAVIASLWDVDDMATKELMVRFYKYLLEENLSKDEALRKAKLDLIKSKKYASPAYWSAFVMYGE